MPPFSREISPAANILWLTPKMEFAKAVKWLLSLWLNFRNFFSRPKRSPSRRTNEAVCLHLVQGHSFRRAGPVPGPTTATTHRLGANTSPPPKKKACRIMKTRDNREERPATVAGQRLYRKSRSTACTESRTLLTQSSAARHLHNIRVLLWGGPINEHSL